MVLKRFLRSIWDDIKALFRGDKRVGPQLGTGRVYTKRDGSGGDPAKHKAVAEPVLTVEAKVIRADGTVETIDAKGDIR